MSRLFLAFLGILLSLFLHAQRSPQYEVVQFSFDGSTDLVHEGIDATGLLSTEAGLALSPRFSVGAGADD